jgi:hypothetical protein
MDWVDLAQEGSCEHGNEPSGSIKFWEVLESCITGYAQEGLSSMKLVLLFQVCSISSLGVVLVIAVVRTEDKERMMMMMINSLETDFLPNNIQKKMSSYIAGNTLHLWYNGLQFNVVRKKTDFYENHIKYTIHSVVRMQSFNVLKQVVHVGTTGFLRVKRK